MYIYSGSPTLIDCTFTNNVTGNSGGGLLIYNNSNPTMTNCTFIRNYAFSGGGMYSTENCSPTLINCKFYNNFAQFEGGGMLNTSSNPTLTDCTFIENLADTGGGMFNKDCNSVLNMCEFVCNTASHYSGAIINSNGQLIANGCFFEKNYPGAITTGSSNTFINCIFSGNTSQLHGGAVQVHMAIFNHCIFDGNKALKYYLNDGTWNPSIGGAVFSRSIVAFTIALSPITGLI
jgi:predicted outer membrane repeat protein